MVMSSCRDGVEVGTIHVLEAYPHDPHAYTQGLEFYEGYLLESTGRYGSSELRRVEPESGEVVQAIALPEGHFGEGLARVDSLLIQLTWQENVAFIYNAGSLALRDTVPFDTMGWGLCYDGRTLFSTSGASILFRRHARTLETLGTIQVALDGAPLRQINELECVGDFIYANVYQSTEIVRVDKATGQVVARFDATDLVPEGLMGNSDAVLNGIAYDAASDSFFITGKLWPVLYRVRFQD